MSAYSEAILALDPLEYYRLDETSGTVMTDSSGNGRSGTYPSSGVTYNVPGAIINDTDTAVSISGTPVGLTGDAFTTSPATFTLNFWIKLAALTGNINLDIATFAWEAVFGVTTTGRLPLYFISNTTAEIAYKSPNAQGSPVSIGAITDTDWHQITIATSGSPGDGAGAINSFYLDGTLLYSAAGNFGSSGNIIGTQSVVVGSAGLNASIDEISVVPTYLSATQIRNTYTAGARSAGVLTGSGAARLRGKQSVTAGGAAYIVRQGASLTAGGAVRLRGNGTLKAGGGATIMQHPPIGYLQARGGAVIIDEGTLQASGGAVIVSADTLTAGGGARIGSASVLTAGGGAYIATYAVMTAGGGARIFNPARRPVWTERNYRVTAIQRQTYAIPTSGSTNLERNGSYLPPS